MTQFTAIEWVGVYLLVGACMLVLLRLYVKLVVRPPQPSEFVTEMMAAVRAGKPIDWRKKAESVLFVPLALLVWPLSVWVGFSEIRKPARTYPEPAPEEKFRCQRENLRMVTTPAEAEKLGVITDPLGRTPDIPFGHLNGAWRTFLSKQEVDFSLWYFEVSSEEALDRHERACKGFAWVKARKVQAEFIFEWN